MSHDDAYLVGLLEEQRACRVNGNTDRLAAVEAEITRVRRAAGTAADEPPKTPVDKPRRTTTRKAD